MRQRLSLTGWLSVMGRRVVAALLSTLLVATALVACASSAPAGPTPESVGATLADYGIATVPFTGGKALHPVKGATVLVLTDWQLQAVAASAPVAKTSSSSAAPRRFVPGIPLTGLDAAATAALPATAGGTVDPETAAITPSALVMTWWAHATSARAKLARAGYPAPKAASTIAPFYVLTLFLADAFGDLGRSGASATASEDGQQGPFALGTGPVAAPDPCGTVAGIIGDVGSFLDNAGVVGDILKGVLGGISSAIQAVAAPVVKAIKIALEVADLALNAAVLLQQWKVELSVNPGSGFSVNYSGNPGVGGTITLKLDGSLGQLPVPVSSCLAVAGLTNPTDQSGSKIRWDGGYEGYQIGIDPSEIVPPANPPGELDKNNQAKYTFTTGTETLDADETETRIDENAAVDVHVQRADVDKLVSWIVSLGGNSITSFLHDVLYAIAKQVATYAGDEWGTIFLPVQYWVAKDKKPGDTQGGGTPPGDTNALPPIANCLAPAKVQDVTQLKVLSRGRGPALGGSGGNTAHNTCTYNLSDGSSIALVLPYSVPADDGPALEQILTSGDGCGTASGYLPSGVSAAGQAVYYAIWSGHSLADAGWVGKVTDSGKVLPELARLAGFC